MVTQLRMANLNASMAYFKGLTLFSVREDKNTESITDWPPSEIAQPEGPLHVYEITPWKPTQSYMNIVHIFKGTF
jgi:hypothetical protein